jgi:hypothetical protein
MFNNTTALNARRRLLAIREVIPSVTTALTRLNKNPENRKLSKLNSNRGPVRGTNDCIYSYYTIEQDLDILLELEYKYGTPKRYRPAIKDVLSYLQKV